VVIWLARYVLLSFPVLQHEFKEATVTGPATFNVYKVTDQSEIKLIAYCDPAEAEFYAEKGYFLVVGDSGSKRRGNGVAVEDENIGLLVVDDDAGILESMKRNIRCEPIDLYVARSGMNALKVLGESKIDVIFLDYHMEGMNGVQLLEKIHTIKPDAKCFMMTGYASVPLAVRAVKAGALDVLEKPVSVTRLIKILNNFTMCDHEDVSGDIQFDHA
jgi:ActR/RegA family two-component response regulator